MSYPIVTVHLPDIPTVLHITNLCSMEGVWNNLPTIVLVAIAMALVAFRLWKAEGFQFLWSSEEAKPKPNFAPGPNPLPVIGSLPKMAGFDPPYAAFTEMAKTYGNVFSVKLGSADCVVVNDQDSVKEVLERRGGDFDNRPDFKRFDILFGGDKQNSLAFSDNSKLQKKRRGMLQPFTFCHAGNMEKLSIVSRSEMSFLRDAIIKEFPKGNTSAIVDIKPFIMKACANIFNEYFCGLPRYDYNDGEFCYYTQNFDEVFWEVNQGKAVEFLPWLMPFMFRSQKRMKHLSDEIRTFVEEIIAHKKNQYAHDGGEPEIAEQDFLDSIMKYIEEEDQEPDRNGVVVGRDTALYALEDILGGHSAVGNITLRIISDLAKSKTISTDDNNRNDPNGNDEDVKSFQEICQDQIDNFVGMKREIRLEDKSDLHNIPATMNETVRLTCSPIVPHQASKDSSINGYDVKKGTVVFINNHALSMDEGLWKEPEKYDPTRFLDSKGNLSKPDHFRPFSYGRRACMGYKIVEFVSFQLVASLLQHFTFEETSENGSSIVNPKIERGMLALNPESFRLRLTRRTDIGKVPKSDAA